MSLTVAIRDYAAIARKQVDRFFSSQPSCLLKDYLADRTEILAATITIVGCVFLAGTVVYMFR